jgi:hypothetical protein
MKKIILVSAFLLALTACSDSDSTSSNGNDYSCSVTRNDNSVVLNLVYKDYGEVRTVVFDSHGKNPYYTAKRTYPTVADAQKDCQYQKDDDYYEHIVCNENTVEVGEPAEDDNMDYYEDYYKRRCAKYDGQYEDGTLAEEYEKNFSGKKQSSSNSIDEPKCEVTREGQSISMFRSYNGSTVSAFVTEYKDENGKVYYVSENIYKDPDEQKAAESCDDLKQMKEIYQDAATLECDGLKSSLKLVEYATVDLDGTEKWYKKSCEDFYKNVNEGAYD